jgi:V8-like Glu-specific endopeptidase
MEFPSHRPAAARAPIVALVAAVALALTPASVPIAAAAPSLENPSARSGQVGSASDYWTPERMRNAVPLPIPEVAPGAEPLGSEDATAAPEATPGTGGPGGPPTVRVEPQSGTSVWDDGGWGESLAGSSIVEEPSSLEEPSSVGTQGCYFSSSRLVPQVSDKKYPYRAVGKLFFTEPGLGDFVCSGAVLRPRVVVTAGHCVHSGNGLQSGFFSNFLFCPAWRGSPNAKYGCWNWAYLTTTTEWFNSFNVVPNAADYAMFEMQDRSINGVPTRIADVVGFFGYQTGVLSANHVHLLGYPVNFDGGNKMHQVASGRCQSGGNNTERYGSDMKGGSSGGPWVQDFGQLANGQTVSNINGPNLIVGITSYSNLSTDPKYQGSSIPDGRFQAQLDNVCAHRAGNC